MAARIEDAAIAQVERELAQDRVRYEVAPFDRVIPTAENIARVIFDYTASQGFPVVEVKLWETESCFASYSVSAVHVARAT